MVPIEWGAGISSKVVAALAHGLPVISSPLSATGLGATDGEHLLIARTDEEFVDCYARLVADDALWQRLSDNGRALVRERFDPAVGVRPLLDWLATHVDSATAGQSGA